MRLDIYRKLYLANQGILQAVHALRNLSHAPGCNRRLLQEIQLALEENRALMNRSVAEVIEESEGRKAGNLSSNTVREKDASAKALV